MKTGLSHSLLQQLCFASDLRSFGSLALVVAHPDDEVIGAGAQLARWAGARFIHVTDGAPRDLRDASAAGFSNRRDYALARSQELDSALAMAGQAAAPRRQLGVADQEASLNLARLARLLAQIWGEWQPDIIVTHPYEGGHPDHDATAFAVHAACGLLRRQHRFPPLIIEMTSYHNCEGRLESSQFLPCSSRSAVTIWLTESRRECKRQLLDCFTTQQKVLKAFRLECERFRLAPRYDFTQPPHLGVLYYEMFDWGMTGRRWRSLAAAALDELASSPKDPVRTPQPCV